MLRKMAATLFLTFIVSAVLLGIWYIYPTNPALVWGLLFFCWVCYRLRLRAISLFGPRNRKDDER